MAISTTTRTGQDLARQRFGAERVFYCPLDLPWAVHAYLNALEPRLLVLAETEFWPNLLTGCFRRCIPVAVVNARISDRSWPRYRLLKRLWTPMLGRIARVLAQTEEDAARLGAIGCSPERVSVAGNLKFDVRAAGQGEATLQLKAMAPGSRFLVAGSTLDGEEAALIAAGVSLSGAHPLLIKVIAPRHPERFEAVAALLDASGVRWARRSDWKAKPVESLPALGGDEFVLLDTVGELANLYSLASVAFVGGSLVSAGGHNPLEPAQFGVPIVMGPSYSNFRAIVEDFIEHNAIRIARKEDFAKVFCDLLADYEGASEMGRRAKEVFNCQAGATDRCIAALRELLLPANDEVQTS